MGICRGDADNKEDTMNLLPPGVGFLYVKHSFTGLPFCPTRAPPVPAHHTWLTPASTVCLFPLRDLLTLWSCFQPCEAMIELLSSFEWKSNFYLIIHQSSNVWVTLSRNNPFLSTHKLRLIPTCVSEFIQCQ
jgi:hypothetical protein